MNIRSKRFTLRDRLPLPSILNLIRASLRTRSKPVPERLVGELHKIESFYSSFLPHRRDVLVYVPPKYTEQIDRRYPVFYMKDGQNLFDPTTSFAGEHWRVGETLDSLITEEAIEPLIVVGIYNTGEARIDEYTPTRDPNRSQGGEAETYGRLIVEELKPLVDAEFRTLTDRANTGIGGSSLGGLVSLYLALEHQEVFSKVAAMSPSVWWGERYIIRRFETLKTKPDLRVWLDIGRKEEKSSIDDARRLRDVLLRKGWRLNRDLSYVEAAGGEHNEHAWGRRVAPMFRFLFPRS